MVDTHCHLNFHSFKKDYAQVAQAAFDVGVTKIINVGAKLDSSRRAVQIAKEIPYCFAAVGVHPHHAEEFPDLNSLEKELNKMIKNGHKKIVAIGETGLDYHMFSVGEGLTTLPKSSQSEDKGQVIRPVPTIKIKKIQTKLLKLHINLAQKFHLPLIIHCRDAYADLLNFLQTTNNLPRGKAGNQLKGVIHCFQGTLSDLKRFLDLGLYIGYDGYITYENSKRKVQSVKYEKIVKNTPLDTILTETDSPWLSPEPLRGHRNTPANVKIICEKIAEIKGITFEEINEITTKNAEKLFFNSLIH